ncbi:OmpA family protein [Nitratiruptor sp. YY09-18]|uniref:OmpA family protein n=1 Tax=Nitratiruptor sp. YY09-18 TaxID=2724901 RepID=UPI00191579EC|nr:OmpA family protein [Nitratiruptor sp. YY09-18]BCD68334.1 peptidoglycan-associated lipoprotein [Nitratiruptor sp. YY09-18]
MQRILLSFLIGFLAVVPLQAKEPGKDHPLISRFPGSKMTYYEQKEFDQLQVLHCPTSKLLHDIKKCQIEPIVGKVTRIKYRTPKKRSAFEIYMNYLEALQNGGYTITANLQTKGVRSFVKDKARFDSGYPDLMDLSERESDHFYIGAVNNDKTAHIMVYVGEGYEGRQGGVAIGVVEKRAMQRGLVTAKAIANKLQAQGHIPIYGIYFDFDKAIIKPESEPTLKEIAKFLQENPKTKVYIVGHTDNQGKFAYNMKLSQKRADAVRDRLISRYHIDPTRIRSYGVGPLCPVATNQTEIGRAKNRRVELVKQ